jgi:2-hydroxychromene-2-carboxylate isomerase
MAINTPSAAQSPVTADVGEKCVDFYFDFISPFGFFASLQIDALAARHGYAVRWRSMLIGVSVLKVMGMKPLLETPLKGPYTVRDADRHSRKLGLQLGRKVDDPLVDPRPAGKAFNWMQKHEPLRSKAFAQGVFHAYWMQGKDIAHAQVLSDVLADVCPDRAGDIAAMQGEEAAALLRQSVDASLARGVFGSPFFLVGDEPFFGVEKLGQLDEWLGSGGW